MRLRAALMLTAVGAACTQSPAPSWPQIGAKAPSLLGTTHEGRAFDLSKHQGPTLLFFGYTFCPDVCPLTLLSMRRLLSSLSNKGIEDAGIVFVTVDPKRDNIERLASYIRAFGPNITAVRPNDLAAMIRELKISVETSPVETETASRAEAAVATETGTASTDAEALGDFYSVNHTATIFLIDRSGHLVERFVHGTSVEQMQSAIEKLEPVK